MSYVSMEEVYLDVGSHYFVYGIGYREGMPWFLVCEEPYDEYPTPHISGFFEIVDDRIPSNWAYRMGPGPYGGSEILPLSWVRDRDFPERLVEGDPETVLAFRALQRDLAIWHGEGSRSLYGLPSWLFDTPVPSQVSTDESEPEEGD